LSEKEKKTTTKQQQTNKPTKKGSRKQTTYQNHTRNKSIGLLWAAGYGHAKRPTDLTSPWPTILCI
jgi:hypothetical protein